MSLHVQFFTVFTMFVSGVMLGILYDGYRVLSAQLRLPRWIVSLLDMAYWGVATALVFSVLYYSNQGRLRLFVFLTLLIGISFYFALLSSFMIKVMRWFIGVIKKCIQLILRCCDLLIITPIIALYKLFMIIIGFLLAVTMIIYRIVIQSCYPVWMFIRYIMNLLLKYCKWPSWMIRIKDATIKGFKRLF